MEAEEVACLKRRKAMTALEDLSRFDADLLTTPSMVLSLLVLSEKLLRAHELNSVALVSSLSRKKKSDKNSTGKSCGYIFR